MTVTRIWPIKNNIHQVVSYAANKSKTDLSKHSDLIDALHYAGDKEKTNLESEQRLLVDGINCDPDIAAQQMIDTKEMYGKTGGIVAYHAYISFKPGEVTPEEAQQVAMEVASKMWAKDYEMVVATHLNANCVHNHFCQGVNEYFSKKSNKLHSIFIVFQVLLNYYILPCTKKSPLLQYTCFNGVKTLLCFLHFIINRE